MNRFASTGETADQAPDDHSSPEPADITDTLNHNSHKNNTSHRPLPPAPRPLRSEHGLNAYRTCCRARSTGHDRCRSVTFGTWGSGNAQTFGVGCGCGLGTEFGGGLTCSRVGPVDP